MSYTIKFVCDWCELIDDEREDAAIHSTKCMYNPEKRSCHTCHNSWPDCKLAENGIQQNCLKWRKK